MNIYFHFICNSNFVFSNLYFRFPLFFVVFFLLFFAFFCYTLLAFLCLITRDASRLARCVRFLQPAGSEATTVGRRCMAEFSQ